MTFAPRLLLAAAAALTLAACDTGTGVNANLAIHTDTLVAYSLNGSPTGSPAGVSLIGSAVVPVTAAFAFEVAFDIDTGNTVRLYPVQKVANGLSATNAVGTQLTSVAFDALTRAPGGTYRYDSTLVVPIGKTVALEISNPTVCTSILTTQLFYAKLMVTSVDPVSKAIKLIATTDPNCGFRSLTTGVPKD
jgi:hypothetical protein